MNNKKNFKFDRRAKKYDEGFEGKASARFYKRLVEEITLKKNMKVLDVGCGTGNILYKLNEKAEFDGYGLDLEEEMLIVARNKLPNMDFKKGSSSQLPYADNSMDIIITCMAYHHFNNQAAFRNEVKRVLKPNGILYICDPRFPMIIRKFFLLYAKVFKIYAKFDNNKELIAEFEKDGFELYGNKKDLYIQVASFKFSPL